MDEKIHRVVLYVHEESKRFTVTARMERARLREVDRQMIDQGYTRIVVAKGLEKRKAEKIKEGLYAEYERKGYTYEPRKPLS